MDAQPLSLSNVFGSHMVLQRGRAIPVWGWATPGVNVTATFMGTAGGATAGADGFWRASLPPQPASATPSLLSVACAATGESVTLSDVLVGDVFLASGQSNMEYSTNDAFNATAELADADNFPLIRVTSGPLQGKFHLPDVLPQPYANLSAVDLPWARASNASIGGVGGVPGTWDFFSAAAWFTLKSTFLLNAARGEANVPLGGIVQCYGGTSIQLWSSPDAIAACPPAPASSCCGYGGNASCLYNAQVAPYVLGPTQLAGVLWYQGEQNAGCGGVPQIDYYACALPALISDWRAKFQQPSLPFGAFQLAAWQASPPNASWFPLLRLIQVNTSGTMPGVFTVSTLDGGDPAGGPVHSPFKQVPGYRAALGLQALVYGGADSVMHIGPRYAGAVVAPNTPSPGDVSVTVLFDPATLHGAGVSLNTSVSCPPALSNASCEAFAVQTGGDCAWYASAPGGPVVAGVSADGTRLTLTLPASAWGGRGAGAPPTIVATRGYFANWPLVQLYAAASALPADPWYADVVVGGGESCPGPWVNSSSAGGAGWAPPADWHAWNAHA